MKRIALLLGTALVALAARAEDRSSAFVAVQIGGGLPLGNKDFTDLHKQGTLAGARVGYQTSYRSAIGAQFSNYTIASDTEPAQDVRLQPITAFFEWDWPWTWYFTPYVVGNVGVSRNHKDYLGRRIIDTGWTAGGAAGLRLRFSEFGDLAIEVGARNFSKGTLDNKNLMVADAAVLFQFYLPESWVPRKAPEDLGLEDLEIPMVRQDDMPELDESLVLQGKIHRLQQQIKDGEFAPMAFEPGGVIFMTTAFNALDNLGAILRLHPDVRVKIYGYVEKEYSGEARQSLAFARAEVVKAYLTQNFRLLDSRLFTEGEKPLPPAEQGAPEPEPSYQLEFECLPVNE